MKRLSAYYALVLSVLVLPGYAQNRIPVDLKDVQLNVNVLQPSLSLEKRLSAKNSVAVSAGLSTFNQMYEDNDYSKFSLNPVVKADLRNYYPRKKVKKDLNPNSGNYIGLLGGYNFNAIAESPEPGETDDSNAFFMGGVWGIQRNYKSGIHLGLHLGAGFITGEHIDLDLTGLLSFELGFVIK